MISMPQMQSIRSRRRNGESIASIARSERVSEPTVRKYLRVLVLTVCRVPGLLTYLPVFRYAPAFTKH